MVFIEAMTFVANMLYINQNIRFYTLLDIQRVIKESLISTVFREQEMLWWKDPDDLH